MGGMLLLDDLKLPGILTAYSLTRTPLRGKTTNSG